MIGPVGPASPGDPRTRLLAASRQLEAVFYQQMLQAMRNAAPVEGGLLEASAGETVFRDLFDESLARLAATHSARGPGMAMFRQLSRHLPPAAATGAAPLGTLENRHGAGN